LASVFEDKNLKISPMIGIGKLDGLIVMVSYYLWKLFEENGYGLLNPGQYQICENHG
jgi:hypothetical protein